MRELILTGHKDTWPLDEKQALFLGQHCFFYNDKSDFLEQGKFQILPSPWKNAHDILDSALYIDKVHDRIIPRLSDIMNSFYGLSYSEKFWKLYMTLWLHNWLNIFYDRYRRLEYIGESFKERFVVKILDEYDPAVGDIWIFVSKMKEDHYHNLLLMSDIINYAQFDFLDCKKVSVLAEASECNKKPSFKGDVRELLPSFKEIIKKHLNNFFTSSVFLGTTYGLSLRDKIYLQFWRDPAFLFKKRLSAPVRVRKVSRCDINKVHLEFGAKNRFEKIVQEVLLKYMPDNLLMLDKYCASAHLDIKTWVGNDIYISQKKCFEIASVLERGGRWISSQHGGGYGQLLSFPYGKFEYEAAGEFITWGWEHKHIYNAAFYALPSPMLSRLKKHKEMEDSIIFVSSIEYAYRHRLQTFFDPETVIDYVRNKKLFFEHLDEKILKKVKYRSCFHKYSSPQEIEIIKKMLSKDWILDDSKLTGFLSRTRLTVIDYPCTAFLEALAMNTPTILYYDPGHVTYCEAAEPYFQNLRSVGILHDSPQAAAEKVNEIWADVPGWWSNSDIQRVKNDFCFQFARSQAGWRNEWARFVKKL